MKLSLDQLAEVNGGIRGIRERLTVRNLNDKWYIVFDGIRTYSWLCFESEALARANLYQTYDALVLSEETGMDLWVVYDIINGESSE